MFFETLYLFAFKHVVALSALIFCLSLESIWQLRPISGPNRIRRFFLNGSFYVMKVGLHISLLVFSLAALGSPEQSKLFHTFSLPLWIELPIVFLVMDLVNYGFHWVSHKNPFLWSIHRVHHSDTQIDTSTAFRTHPLESVLTWIWIYSVLLVLNPNPFAYKTFVKIQISMSLLQHSNIKIPAFLDRWLSTILLTPGLHRVHHDQNRDRADTNYGIVFSFWDRLFGQLKRVSDSSLVFGVKNFAQKYQSFWGLVVSPWGVSNR